MKADWRRLAMAAIAAGMFLTTPSAAFSKSCEALTEGPDVDAIKLLEERGALTNVEGDTLSSAEEFFAEDFVTIDTQGNLLTRADILSTYENGRLQPWARRMELQDLDIRVYCDTAIVFGAAQSWAIGMPDAAPPILFRFLHVWLKREGRWTYTAQHASRVNANRTPQ